MNPNDARLWRDVPGATGGVWRDAGLLGWLLIVDSLLAVVVVRYTPFCAPNQEYLADGLVLATRHRISDDFLPVGYSALLGAGAWLDGQRGVAALSVGLSLLLIVAAWVYLRAQGVSVRGTFAIAGLLSIYPDFLLSLHKVQETALTGVLLLAFVGLLKEAAEEDHFGRVDVGLALTLAWGILMRANLLLLVAICWIVFWRLRVPRAISRLVLQMVVLVACYVGVTTAVHGRPFLPRYGAYNVYSGFNERTQDFRNEEDSLFLVLPEHQVRPPHGAASFTTENLRDPSLDPIYTRLALQFIKEHPVRSLALVGLKFWDLMGPNFSVHRAASSAGVLKILMAMGVPLWVVALLTRRVVGRSRLKLILLLTAAAYVVPFLFTVSNARFREPLDLLCWVDLGGVVCAVRVRETAAAKSTPRPATAMLA